jgi:DNA-binding MarR family transcriptional regulator
VRQRDSVDRIVEGWAEQRPDLDASPVAVITRIYRVRAHLDAALNEWFREQGLTNADFAVLVTLRRLNAPVTVRALADEVALTPGSVSVRLDRMERLGLAERTPDHRDGRGVLVTLTDAGRQAFDRLAPAHLANEARLLSALSAEDQAELARLLGTLLQSFEHDSSLIHAPLGLGTASAPESRRTREQAGLSAGPGLLVTAVLPESPAATAGLRRGDLLTHVDDRPVLTLDDLSVPLHPGAEASLRYLRGETPATVRLRVPGVVLPG